MKKNGTVILLYFFFVLLGLSASLPQAKLTVKIVDEDGEALSNMLVTIGFSEESFNGLSDSKGLFSATGKERYGDVGFGCTNTGYYPSFLQYRYPDGDTNNNCWLPWNPVATLVMRRMINPIPAYWKAVEARIPEENVVVGFDLKLGDWVYPYGSGQVSDLPILFSRQIVSRNEYEGKLTVMFTNSYDGIIVAKEVFGGSQFLLLREAPESGYQATHTYLVGKSQLKGKYGAHVGDPEEHYYFRVRSEVGQEGDLQGALYGKIYGHIKFSGVLSTNKPLLSFTYYLNPTPNDRNLEFDPKQNLFTDLKPSERVTVP